MKLRLKEVLDREGRQISWVAKKLDISKRSIYYWCNNSRRPLYDQFMKLAKLLNVTAEELIDDERTDEN